MSSDSWHPCQRNPSRYLTNEDNIGGFAIQSHQKAHQASIEARKHAEEEAAQLEGQIIAPSMPAASDTATSTTSNANRNEQVSLPKQTQGKKRRHRSLSIGSDRANVREIENDGSAKGQKRACAAVVDGKDSSTDEDIGTLQNSKTLDIDQFFEAADRHLGKSRRKCKFCSNNVYITNHVSTLHRHIESITTHTKRYKKWCTENSIKSKLPKDVKAYKATLEEKSQQNTLDDHLTETQPRERVIPYSDKLFCQVAIEWLIATDQPLRALEHPKFKEMITVAAHATNGVKIPDGKAMRAYIMELFWRNIKNLQTRLTSLSVAGEISLTCDAWQAGNQDAYYTITGRWIEENSPGVWTEKSGLLGFTQMNTAHDGVRLGRALYKIVKRLGITHKIGHVTCDNAANNNTMLADFASCLDHCENRRNMKPWNYRTRHIRCLAHVINLATQAVIAVYSPTKHYDPAKPNDHDPDVKSRDVVGLVRAIVVKARSSAKRKEVFLQLQRDDKGFTLKQALMLLIDMKVRWSSTYTMLQRAWLLKKYVDRFIRQLALDESNAEKATKLSLLRLSSSEWDQVKNFLSLLEIADRAQQAFSAENAPTLHNGIPALEALHAAWTNRKGHERYSNFAHALNAGLEKIEQYYDKISESRAYTFAMLLDPSTKMSHFVKHWDSDLQKEIREMAEAIFKERHQEMGVSGSEFSSSVLKPKTSKISRLIAELSDDELDDWDEALATMALDSNLAKPWLCEFNQYLDSIDIVPEGMSLPTWWGMNAQRLPVWASLARDYLAVMSSSVSSERAFSSAGITISKRRNRLKGDIVEALQFLKCAMRSELLYRDPGPSSLVEEGLEICSDDEDGEWVDVEEEQAWDKSLI